MDLFYRAQPPPTAFLWTFRLPVGTLSIIGPRRGVLLEHAFRERLMRSLLMLSLLALVMSLRAEAAELQVGDEAPEFNLPGSDGETYQLADFEGKQAVVLAWYPKAFTGGCTKECKSLREQGEAVRQYEVAYFAASVDQPELNKKFAQSLDLDFPILSDPSKQVAQAYGVVGPSRQVAQRWTYYIGKDGKILAIDKQVNVASHGADIANKLAELGVDKK